MIVPDAFGSVRARGLSTVGGCDIINLVNDAAQMCLQEKAGRIEARMTASYGVRVWKSEQYAEDVLGALIATILSQNTSDLNSGRAYQSLKQAFPAGWESVRLASVTAVAAAIRPGGLADMKAPRIQHILHEVYERNGQTNLDHLAAWTDGEIGEYLRSFPGVGPKTAACVLMFHLGRDVLPVDTHVHRVSQRLGLIGPKVTPDQAHDLLPRLLEPGGVYSFHVHLIEHGRKVCHSRNPQCTSCPVQPECDYYQRAQAAAWERDARY